MFYISVDFFGYQFNILNFVGLIMSKIDAKFEAIDTKGMSYFMQK